MFIDTTKFKKAVKDSYNGLGLQVTHFEDGIIQVKGTSFILNVHKEDINNKCMAALVEFIGQLPSEGKTVEYAGKKRKDSFDVIEPDGHHLLENFTKGQKMTDTRIMVQREETCYSVFQNIETMESCLIRRDSQLIVDPYKVDDQNDEMPPSLPVLYGYLLIWNNDTMQFGVPIMPCANNGEKEFLRLINGKNMCWPFID